jgi:signal transduction histidine kinase/HPt (histidine-containing phosphotransfer) domain-containing protein/ActR/RegA family two-component response regulator
MKFNLILRENYRQLVFVFLSFSAMVVISYFFAGDLVERYMSSNAEEVLAAAETRVIAQLREAEVTLLSAALTLRKYQEMDMPPELITEYLAELVRRLDRERPGGLIGVYGYLSGGSFVDGGFRGLPGGYDPREQPWYVRAVDGKGSPVFTGPYRDARNREAVISVSMLIKGDDGGDYGVVSCDMNFDEIAAYVEGLQFSKGGYGMLLGSDMIFIAHPDTYYQGRQLQELSAEHSKVAKDFAAGKNRLSVIRLRNNQGTSVVAFYQKIDNGWYMGIATPKKSYYQDIHSMAFVLSAVGLILMLVLSYILLHLSMAKISSEEESKSKSSFLAKMSHEIRTPMNSILGMSEIIQRKNIPGEIFEYISIIRQSGNTLLSIINDILDFSKIESGHVQIDSKEYYFSSLINDVINVIRVRLVGKPLDFFVSVDSNIPALLVGDEARVRQILINLLNNAVKYTREGHVFLKVEMRIPESHKIKLIFRVSDTGIGIKKEDLKDLFDEFTRMDMNRNQGIEGTGLGLSIANALCNVMGGEITVSSEYGKGSEFTASMIQIFDDIRKVARVDNPEARRVLIFEERPLYFETIRYAMENLGVRPVYAGDLPEFIKGLEEDYEFAFVPSKYAMDCIPVWGKKGNTIQLVIMMGLGEVAVYRDTSSILMPIHSVVLANVLNGIASKGSVNHNEVRLYFTAPWTKVLIVDDIQTNLRVAVELMAPYDMEIDTCQSGAEAVEMVKKNRYDLVFMDHMMPGLDGIETTALIRKAGAEPYYQNLPVIMLTANAVSGRREMFLENGINDFLAKPIETQKLNVLLEKWIPQEKRIAITDPAKIPEPVNALPPEIPGVFTQKGLENTGGSLPVYFSILSVFVRDANERIDQIKEAAETGDLGLFTTLVHALKSASRSVGADELGESAARLEEAGKARNALVVTEKTGPFLESLRRLIADISDALATAAAMSEPSETTDISVLHLEDLKEALVNMDIEKVNKFMLEYSIMPLSAGARELVTKIKEDILLFEYDKAVARIQELL